MVTQLKVLLKPPIIAYFIFLLYAYNIRKITLIVHTITARIFEKTYLYARKKSLSLLIIISYMLP